MESNRNSDSRQTTLNSIIRAIKITQEDSPVVQDFTMHRVLPALYELQEVQEGDSFTPEQLESQKKNLATLFTYYVRSGFPKDRITMEVIDKGIQKVRETENFKEITKDLDSHKLISLCEDRRKLEIMARQAFASRRVAPADRKPSAPEPVTNHPIEDGPKM